MPQGQERYLDQLMERVREDRYPSLDLLDRIESSLWDPDQWSSSRNSGSRTRT